MNSSNFLGKMRNNLGFIILSALIVASVVFAVSSFITPKYRSDASILVIQKQPEDKVDAFSAAKSAEYLSDIFSKIIYTDSFMEDVLKSPMNVQKKFSSNKEDRKKEWAKEVKTKKVNNTGIIKISVYDPSKKEAEKIVQAISWNLSTNSQKYHGGGEKITATVIDGPITSNLPASPNILLNILLGFIVGLSASIGYLYFLSDNKEESENFTLYRQN